MFYDTKHNTLKTVMSNLHKAFAETAEKMWAYWRCLPTNKRPGDGLVVRMCIPYPTPTYHTCLFFNPGLDFDPLLTNDTHFIFSQRPWPK
ncbi:hypothetical protein BDP67DRAFT_513360 [Colletotrichum lupini]|nr:hypothetical protein BDP67DRAFT_513360 [Colletotrichum lupini]